MDTKTLEVLGVGALRDHLFLVYFSDRTYATVSAEELAKHFPDRQTVPESVTEDLFSGPGYHASRAAMAGQVFGRMH